MTTATAATTTRPPLPPFTRESAIQKGRLAEDAWNTRDSEKVTLEKTHVAKCPDRNLSDHRRQLGY